MTVTEPQIGAFVAVLARAGGLAVTAPVIGDSGVPVRARLIFVMAIAFVVGPNRQGILLSDVAGVAIMELAVGLLTGLTARFVMSRAAIAGQLMGLSLGLGFASQYDHNAGESAGTLRMMITSIAGLIFLATGGLESIIQSASSSPATIGQLAVLGPQLLHEGTAAFGHGLALAAPIILASLVGNVGLALINRAAPAANIFSIALVGVLVLGGIALLATSGELVGGLVNDARSAIDVLQGTSV
ncbi:MAG TPA: flagellar biosynthetic protein FliR [Kofleriaceae bacterium]